VVRLRLRRNPSAFLEPPQRDSEEEQYRNERFGLTPSAVQVDIKTRQVTVTGPRGVLKKDLSHLSVSFSHPEKDTVAIEMHHGARKNVAALRTVRTLIYNMIVGVTKGYKYKMRYVYAHFPINVNLEKNNETDRMEVEIRNFLGEKLVRRVVMADGVDVEASKNVKDELQLTGNDLEKVSQSAADIQQICRVRNKDIRKVRLPLLRPCAPSTAAASQFLEHKQPLLTHPTVLGRSLRLGAWQHCRGVRAKLVSSLWRKTDQGTLLHYGLRSASMKTGRFFADQNFINDFKNKDSLFCSTERLYTNTPTRNAQQCSAFELFAYLNRYRNYATLAPYPFDAQQQTVALRLMYPSVHGLSKRN
jgi:large subunit ribosomal protein L9e